LDASWRDAAVPSSVTASSGTRVTYEHGSPAGITASTSVTSVPLTSALRARSVTGPRSRSVTHAGGRAGSSSSAGPGTTCWSTWASQRYRRPSGCTLGAATAYLCPWWMISTPGPSTSAQHRPAGTRKKRMPLVPSSRLVLIGVGGSGPSRASASASVAAPGLPP